MIKRGGFRRSGGHFRGAAIFQSPSPSPSGDRGREPVGGSKVPSTFVRQFDRCGTLSAGRQAPCAQTSRLRSRASVRRAVAGLAVSLQRLILRHIILPCQPLPTLWFTRSSRAPWSPLLASLSSSLLMPTARSSLGSLVIGGGGGASSSCYRRGW